MKFLVLPGQLRITVLGFSYRDESTKCYFSESEIFLIVNVLINRNNVKTYAILINGSVFKTKYHDVFYYSLSL